MKREFKPHDILSLRVKLGGSDWVTYVEAISYPFGEGKDEEINVRMIPGDPCSMKTVSTADLVRHVEPPKSLWVQFGEVRGSGQFPWDMLRYDRCWPVNFDLSFDDHGRCSIEMKSHLDLEDDGRNRLFIARVADTKKAASTWTYGRWGSFLWSVGSASSPQKVK